MIGSTPRMLGFLCLLVFGMFPVAGRTASIVVLGDSISAGAGLENPDQVWVALLQKRLREQGRSIDVVNAGISGDTTAGGLARVDGLLDRYRPSVLLLELGANDGLRGVPPAQIRANLAEIIARAQAREVKVLLLGMRIPPNYGKRYNDLFEAVFPAVAEQCRVPYVAFLLEGVGGNKELMQADGLHPNTRAQPVLLEHVWKQLLALL